MDVWQLTRALGARLLDPDRTPDWQPCPVCARGVPGDRGGIVRLCLPCTEAEAGETLEDLTRRVSRKLTRRQYDALPRDNDDRPILPELSYRDWRRLHG